MSQELYWFAYQAKNLCLADVSPELLISNEKGKNSHATKQENNINRLLKSNGFVMRPKFVLSSRTEMPKTRQFEEWKKSGLPLTGIPELSLFFTLDPGQFYYQPLGTQKFPDWLWRDFDGRYGIAEGKKYSKTVAKALMNEGHVIGFDNALYLFSLTRQSTIFMGSDAVTTTELKIFDRAKAEGKTMGDKYNRELGNAHHINFRPQFGMANPFTDSMKLKRENNALEFCMGT